MSSLSKLRIPSLCLSIIFSCFNYGFSGLVSGTLIATPCGLIPVEKLNVGDKVLSYDISTQNPEDALIEVSITKIDKHLADTIFGIITENENWVDVSPQQLFFTFKPTDAQSDNAAIVDFVQAQNLTTKNMIIDINMSCIPIVEINKTELNGTPAQQYSEKIKKDKHDKIVAIEKRMVKVDVYSIEVEEPHTFLVADKSYFAKNKNHHLFIAHNGLAELSLGVSLAFDSTPASVSFAEATLTAGGMGAKFGPYGWAAGFTLGVGYFLYNLFSKNNNNRLFLEKSDQNGGSSSNGPRDPKKKNNKEYPEDFRTNSTKDEKATFKSERDARNLARKQVGNDPVDIGDNKLRSQDGKWQYRAKPKDIAGEHAGGEHIHLERLNPETGEVLDNWHLFWQ